MKPGTIVMVTGYGLATVVYHNLDGYGVIRGNHIIDPKNLPEPEAMLRNPYPSAEYPCIGDEYTILVRVEDQCQLSLRHKWITDALFFWLRMKDPEACETFLEDNGFLYPAEENAELSHRKEVKP